MGPQIVPKFFSKEILRAIEQRKDFNILGTTSKFKKDLTDLLSGYDIDDYFITKKVQQF